MGVVLRFPLDRRIAAPVRRLDQPAEIVILPVVWRSPREEPREERPAQT